MSIFNKFTIKYLQKEILFVFLFSNLLVTMKFLYYIVFLSYCKRSPYNALPAHICPNMFNPNIHASKVDAPHVHLDSA